MHELQQILLKKLPRLGELTFGCEVKSKHGISIVLSNGETDGEEWMTFKLFDGTIGGDEHVGEFEILGHKPSHSDLLEALGEDWAMDGEYHLLHYLEKYWYTNKKGMLIPFYLPQNLSDLSLPEYEETRKQLISLLK